MLRTVLPLALVLAACGPKDSNVQAAGAGIGSTQVPDDASSRKFAVKLLGLQVLSWTPSTSGAVQLVYNTLTFLDQNRWQADATLSVLDEETSCRENGVWTMEPARSSNTATVEMTVEKTSCPDREAGTTVRVDATILQDGTYKFVKQ